jgi:lysine-specific demethylase 3
MYNALKDKDTIGSTRLHKDIANAWNVLTFAVHVDGYAIWVVFDSQDGDRLAEWLQKQFGGCGNLIHQQQIFLTEGDLATLFAETGIQPYIIHQHPGDMLFIPAGCAHQVGAEISLLHFSHMCLL